MHQYIDRKTTFYHPLKFILDLELISKNPHIFYLSVNATLLVMRSSRMIENLGVTQTERMSINEDTERVTGTFLRKFHGIYSNFFRSEGPVLYHLFKPYVMSFYGMETWFHNVTKQPLKKISVGYHRSVKRICGLSL